MNEKLQKICEGVLEDENESKKFMELETFDDMYEYFKEKVPELTEEEFDDFIYEILESYAELNEQEPELVTESLNQVAGGVNLAKLSKQIVSGALALTSLSSIGMVAAKSPYARSDYQSYKSSKKHYKKSKGFFPKAVKWMERHKLLVAGVSLAAATGTVFAVKYLLSDKEEGSVTNSEITKIANRLAPYVNDLLRDHRAESMTKELDDLRRSLEEELARLSSNQPYYRISLVKTSRGENTYMLAISGEQQPLWKDIPSIKASLLRIRSDLETVWKANSGVEMILNDAIIDYVKTPGAAKLNAVDISKLKKELAKRDKSGNASAILRFNEYRSSLINAIDKLLNI